LHNRRMTKIKKSDYSAMTLRLPHEVMERLDAAAAHNGRTRSDEIRARLEASPTDERLGSLEREVQEMKGMLRKLLDAAG
jgi:predicted transcriptional regulator